MSYEKHNWESQEVITANKLNHLEDGIESCSSQKTLLIRTSQQDGYTVLDKTWKEIYDIIISNGLCLLEEEQSSNIFRRSLPRTVFIGLESQGGKISFGYSPDVFYEAASPNDYPKAQTSSD